MKKSTSVLWGLALILIAAYVVINKLGIVENVPVVAIIISLACLYFIVRGIFKINFFEIFIPIALLGCVYSDIINEWMVYDFNKLIPLPIFFVALLLAIGFSLIFKSKKKVDFGSREGLGNRSGGAASDKWVTLKSTFDGATRYVNSQCLEGATIDNNFGKNVVYFNNAVLSSGSVQIDVDNNFGETALYLPNTWKLDLTKKSACGSVKIHGFGNADGDAPVAHVNVSNAFGAVDIYFE